MSSEIRELLRGAGADTDRSPDVGAALRRGRRLRWRRRVAGVGITAVITAGGFIGYVAASRALDLGRPTKEPLPETGERSARSVQVTTVDVRGTPTLVSASFGSAWVAHSSESGQFVVSRIDSRSGSVVEKIPLDGLPVATDISGGRVWVATKRLDGARGGTILAIDAAANAISERIDLKAAPTDLSADGGGAAWITTTDGTVTRIRESGRVGPSIRVRGRLVTADSEHVWVAETGGTLTEIDATMNRVVDRVRIRPNVVGLEATRDYLWVTQHAPNGTLSLTKMDSTTGEVAGSLDQLELGPGQFAVGASIVWIPLQGLGDPGGAGEVLRVDLNTVEVIGEPIKVGSGPVGIAVDGGRTWVANFDDGTVSVITAG